MGKNRMGSHKQWFVMIQDSKCLSQEITLVLEWHKRTR